MLAVAAAQSTPWGLWVAVAAVVVDSVVTLLVGRKLVKAAEREAAKAAETVKPALATALNEIVVKLMPVVVEVIKQHLAGKDPKDNEQTPGTIRSIEQ